MPLINCFIVIVHWPRLSINFFTTLIDSGHEGGGGSDKGKGLPWPDCSSECNDKSIIADAGPLLS